MTRPHMRMKAYPAAGILIAAAMAAVTLGCPPASITPGPSSTVLNYEMAAFAGVNAQRTAHGLTPLTMDASVRAVARAHSKDMAARNYFAHVNPEGRNHADRLTAAGIATVASGENLFYSMGIADPPSAAVDGWMNSAGHRANILDADGAVVWTHTGMGVALEGSEAYFTQVFVRYTWKDGRTVRLAVFGDTGEIVELPADE